MTSSDFLPALRTLIRDSDECHAGDGGIEPRVVLPQMSDTDDACPQILH
jgi:hypothetical protein